VCLFVCVCVYRVDNSGRAFPEVTDDIEERCFFVCWEGGVYRHTRIRIQLYDYIYTHSYARKNTIYMEYGVWMSYVTRMNESCHTHECVMSLVWYRYTGWGGGGGGDRIRSCLWCRRASWVMWSNVTRIVHVTHMIIQIARGHDSQNTPRLFIQARRRSHVTRMIESWHKYESVMSHV